MSKKTQPTLVTFLLDRSQSMVAVLDETIGAFNTYLDTLQAENKATINFTLVTFDTQSIDKICVAVPVGKAPRLDTKNYVPRAATPLIDAAYKTIKAVEAQEAAKGSKIVVCIQTDGEENSSREHSWEDLKTLIDAKTKDGWQFNFMGAGINAYDQGSRMGIMANSTVSYGLDAASTSAAFAASATNTSRFASGQSVNTAYSASQKQASGDKFSPDLNLTQTSVPTQVSVPAQTVVKTTTKIVQDFSL